MSKWRRDLDEARPWMLLQLVSVSLCLAALGPLALPAPYGFGFALMWLALVCLMVVVTIRRHRASSVTGGVLHHEGAAFACAAAAQSNAETQARRDRTRSKFRRDALDAQQLLLPRVAGLLLIVAGLSAVTVPWPYGLIICLVAVTVLALLLRQNARRRREGIDVWPTALILGPYVALSLVVLVGHLVSERLAGVLAVALVVVGLGLLLRRLRRSGEPARAAHYFRGATTPGDIRE